MAGPALRHREDPGRAAARVRRETHGRGVERGGRPRGTDDALLRIIRGESGDAVLAGTRLHHPGIRIPARDREDLARNRRRGRREDDRDGFERNRDPPPPRPILEGTARGEPGGWTGFHSRAREPPGESGRPPANRNSERNRGRDTKQARRDAGPSRRHGRSHPRRGVSGARVPFRDRWLPHVEVASDSAVTWGTVSAKTDSVTNQGNHRKLKYPGSMSGPARGISG